MYSFLACLVFLGNRGPKNFFFLKERAFNVIIFALCRDGYESTDYFFNCSIILDLRSSLCAFVSQVTSWLSLFQPTRRYPNLFILLWSYTRSLVLPSSSMSGEREITEFSVVLARLRIRFSGPLPRISVVAFLFSRRISLILSLLTLGHRSS